MRRTVIALLLLVSGAATAVAQTAKQNPSAQAPQKGHCDVGVISPLGETFSAWKGTIHENVPVESWHIADLVVDRIRAALSKRAAVQRIPYRKEAVVTRPLLWMRIVDRTETLRRLATGTRCARYVFVKADDNVHGYANEYAGLGIRSNHVVHAVFSLWVFDGETFALLRSAHMENTRPVDESLWPDPPNSAAQNAKLRDVTRELVARELDRTLPKLLPTLTSQNARP